MIIGIKGELGRGMTTSLIAERYKNNSACIKLGNQWICSTCMCRCDDRQAPFEIEKYLKLMKGE